MVSSWKYKVTSAAVILVASMVVGAGCGDGGTSSISVTLFGWMDSGGQAQFVDDIQQFPGAQQLRIAVTNPGSRTVVDEEIAPIGDRGVSFPELKGGDGLRMDFELHDGTGAVAAGATPTFDAEEGGDHRGFRTMISPVNDFAPVGALFHTEAGETLLATGFDDRRLDTSSLGRVGHTAHETDTGEVLVVGGAQLSSTYEPTRIPVLDQVFDDIQLFNPATGHFTELAGDSAADDAGVIGQDRLHQPRAFHTVTPLGDDRFLVIGGFGRVSEATQPQDSVEMIDLNAEPGNRVQNVGTLQHARGMHSASLRSSDQRVVVAGGLGQSDEDVLDTAEVVDPEGGSVDVVNLNTARVGQAAVTLEDNETVWLIGGRDGVGVLDSTETVDNNGAQPGPQMDQPRNVPSALILGSQHNHRVLIMGGLTSGGATANYEIGNPLRLDHIFSDSSWNFQHPRGDASAFILRQSRDLVIFGGFDPDGNVERSAERRVVDLDATPPLRPAGTTMGQMHQVRGGFSATAVSSGRILIVGGDEPGNVHNNAEYFTPHDPVQ